MAAIQFGHCSQQPILGRTVRLDGNVEGLAPVEGDDQRVSGLLLRRAELRPGRVGGCLTGNLGAGGDLYLTCGAGEGGARLYALGVVSGRLTPLIDFGTDAAR